MAISYANTGFGFVDSSFGSAANSTGIKENVPKIWENRYHKAVQAKSMMTKLGLIGPDSYDVGDYSGTKPGYPIIRKTELSGKKGDEIIMGLKHDYTVNHASGGKVQDDQLVDNEDALDLSVCKVKIERHRFGLRGNGGMNEQRNPYESQPAMFDDSLTDGAAKLIDTSLLYASWCGWSPHIMRVFGVTNCAPTAPALTLYGNDLTFDTTRTIANLVGGGADNVSAKTFEIGAALMAENNRDPVMIDGEPYWLSFVSERGALALLQDDRFNKANLYARERGKSNPLFRNAEFVWNNCIIYRYDKIRTILAGLDPTATTVSSKALVEASYTGIGGGLSASDIHHTLFFGANAVAYAEGQFKTQIVRDENDYGNIIGRATDLIYGAQRIIYKKQDGTTKTEQGMAMIVNTVKF